MAPSRRAQLTALANRISVLLPAWQAQATDIVSSEYFFEARNGLSVIRLEIRPELQGRIDRDAGLFAHEHTVMVLLERDSNEAIMWDKGGYDDPEFLGEAGVTHYLCDLARLAEIDAAITAQRAVTDAERASLCGPPVADAART